MAPSCNAVRLVLALGSVIFAAGSAEPVKIPAPVSKDVVELVVRDGDVAVLDCQEHRWSKYYVDEPQQLAWKKDGKDINLDKTDTGRIYQSPNGSLVIRNFKSQHNSGIFNASPDEEGATTVVEKTDVGKYQCAARGPLGKVVFAPIFVHSAKAPSFNSDGHPNSTSVRIGGVARFRCFVDRETLPPASYSWKVNQDDLPQKNSRFTVLPGGILQIANVRAGDSGLYQCIAANGIGSASSNVATLSVTNGTASTSSQSRPAFFIARPSNITANVRTDAFFECLADGYPAPKISWFHSDGRPVRLGSKYLMNGLGNLRILNVSTTDHGSFTCKATTSHSLSVSSSAFLEVARKPYIREAPVGVTKVAAETARFVCHADVEERSDVKWLKDGKPLLAVGRLRLLHSGSNLVISQTSAADAGVYQCFVENKFGFASSAANLFFVQSPQAPRRPEVSVVSKSSSSITIEWNLARGRDTLPIVAYTVHYFKNVGDVEQQKIETSSRTTLLDLEPFTNYTMYVVAYNKDSASEHSAYLTVATEAGLPLQAPVPIVNSITDSVVTVDIQQLSLDKARGMVQEYTVYYKQLFPNSSTQKKIIPGSSRFFNIVGLLPATSYKM